MIRTETEYCRALEGIKVEKDTLRVQREHLTSLGLSEPEVQRTMQPLLSLHAQLEEEVDAYAKMKRGDLGTLTAIGRWLIGAHIARGISQGDLAERLGVDASQVSRDERNDYRNVTVERALRIMNALGLPFTASAESVLEPDVSAAYA